jgi:hypothetical protein
VSLRHFDEAPPFQMGNGELYRAPRQSSGIGECRQAQLDRPLAALRRHTYQVQIQQKGGGRSVMCDQIAHQDRGDVVIDAEVAVHSSTIASNAIAASALLVAASRAT